MDRALHPSLILPLLASLAACEPGLATASNILEPTTEAENPPDSQTGKICFLLTIDTPQSVVRMVASKRIARIRYQGRSVRLRSDGERVSEGGTFRGPDTIVTINNVAPDLARSDEPFQTSVRVIVRVPGKAERFRANWFCEGLDE